MTDREIIVTALAGESAKTDTPPDMVLAIAFEFLCAEAEALVHDGADDYSLAMAHAARCKALGEFVAKHMDVEFVERPVTP